MTKTWQQIQQSPQLLQQYLVRERVIDGIRNFFKQANFHEVETPVLVESPGTEPYLNVFQASLEMDAKTYPGFLLTSPEYAMKKLLVAGLPRIFQVCKSFRNDEPYSSSHNPEFTILEWYRSHADYRDIMNDCEQLLLHLIKSTGKETFSYQGREYDVKTPWPRISVAEAFERYVGVDTDGLLDRTVLATVAAEKGYAVTSKTTWDELFYQLFLNEIEPRLAEMNQPVFVYDYPVAMAALSKRKTSDPRFAERFEWYLGGLELGNAFSELTDPDEQLRRFEDEIRMRTELGKPTYPIDQDFITALRTGMPESGGIAVGVDRLIMLLADVPTIKDTLFFPVEDVFSLE